MKVMNNTNITNGLKSMNKEQRKFKKVIKVRKLHKKYIRRLKNSSGDFLKSQYIVFRKSRKNVIKLKEKSTTV